MTIPVLFLGGVLLAMRKDTVLALIMLVFVPVVFVIVTVIGRKIEPLWVISDSYVDKQNDIVRERLHGIRVIRAFNSEPREHKRIDEATHVMADNIIHANVSMGLVSPLTIALMNMAAVLIVWIGGWRMENGLSGVSGGDIFAIVQYVALTMNGVVMAAFMIVMLPHAKVAAGRIGVVLDSEGIADPNPEEALELKGDIEFKHVSFCYDGASVPAVEDVSLHIRAGEKVAVIGGQRQIHSGAAADELPPADVGQDLLRWARRRHDKPQDHPRQYELRAPAPRDIFRQHPPEYRDGPPRRERGGDRGGRRHRADGRLCGQPARRAGAYARAVRQESLRRAEAAHMHRPRDTEKRPDLYL